MTVVTGLFMDLAEALGDGGGDHSRACGVSERRPRQESDTVVEAEVSMDQIAARAFERETQLSSFSCKWTTTASSARATSGTLRLQQHDIVAHADAAAHDREQPRVVFERLFGASDSTDRKVRAARSAPGPQHPGCRDGSRQAAAAGAGAADNRKVNDYLAAAQRRERRIS